MRVPYQLQGGVLRVRECLTCGLAYTTMERIVGQREAEAMLDLMQPPTGYSVTPPAVPA